jgi:chromatin segregation and condensation protein Rec8/ScpA/Scc1 (kleisin family)
VLDTAGIFLWDIEETVEQAEKVATLLGMLELTKAKVASIYQERPFGKDSIKEKGG